MLTAFTLFTLFKMFTKYSTKMTPSVYWLEK